MAWYEAGGLMLGLLLAQMAIGMPVFLAFLTTNAIGVMLFMGGTGDFAQLISNATVTVTSFLLVPVPLFILMGEIFFHTGLALRVFEGVDKMVGRLPGRLSYLAVVRGTIFATLSGSSIASGAMMASMLVPEMTKRGYSINLSVGPILGSGGLAMIIPPSALAVLLGSLARIDIGALLIAGLFPGMILGGLYVINIFIHVKVNPEAAPEYDVASTSLLEKLWAFVTNILPMVVIVFAVVGVIILGIATPSESGAFGVFSVLALAAAYRRLTVDAIVRAVRGTLIVTGMTFIILVGSSTFSQIMAFAGASSGLVVLAGELRLGPTEMLLVMFTVLVLLGMFVDQLSQMMLTLPIFMPLIVALGFDPIWFGVVMLLAMEISLITPPFGVLLFVMMGAGPPGATLPKVALAGLPYILCGIVLLGLLIAFPGIALYLPGLAS